MSNAILLLVVLICVLFAYVSYLLWMQRVLKEYVRKFQEDTLSSDSETMRRLEELSNQHEVSVKNTLQVVQKLEGEVLEKVQ